MSKSTKLGLFFLSFSMIFVAGLLFILARQRFNRYCAAIPDGSTVNGFPIEGLSADQIAESLLSIYNAPVQLRYEENLIQVSAGQLGLSLIDTEMIRSSRGPRGRAMRLGRFHRRAIRENQDQTDPS